MKLILIIILSLSIKCSYSQKFKVEKYFEWFNKDHIIQNLSFAHSDTEVVFSKKIQEQCDANPGGIYSESKIKKDIRYSDPVVTILNLKTKKITTIDYGWTPSFSENDSLILYTFQKKSLFKKRVLAQTMDGNNIKLYNRNSKKSEILVNPKNNFLLNPEFLDSIIVIYNLGAAVNGACEGSVGLNTINIKTKKTEAIYTPKIKFVRPNEIGVS